MGQLARIAVGCAAFVMTDVSLAEAEGSSSHRSLRFEVLTRFESGVDIPESITTDTRGNLYLSVGTTIQRQRPDGALGVFATLPLPIFSLGLKVGPDGCVYNASTSLSEVPGAFVWRVCAQDAVEVFAELDHGGGPNDLAFSEDGDLFVTDPVLGRIWKIPPEGAAEVFLEHPLLAGDPENPALLFRPIGVNGIAFDRHDRNLYVSNTDRGTIVRIPMRSGTREPSVFADDAALRGADGIAFDRAGVLFVAVNASDSLVAVSRHGAVRVLAGGPPLDAPSSIVFGATGRDAHRMYVTSSSFSRTLGLQPGAPAPALIAARVATPGLPLR